MQTSGSGQSSAYRPSAAEAITFALDHLEAFEMGVFFKEWQEGHDMQSWRIEVEDRTRIALALPTNTS